jgi:hypothetical protein
MTSQTIPTPPTETEPTPPAVSFRRRVRLVLDFPHQEALAEFVESLNAGYAMNAEEDQAPEQVGAYRKDSLDELDEIRIPPSRQYVLRRRGERPEKERLTSQLEREETRRQARLEADRQKPGWRR